MASIECFDLSLTAASCAHQQRQAAMMNDIADMKDSPASSQHLSLLIWRALIRSTPAPSRLTSPNQETTCASHRMPLKCLMKTTRRSRPEYLGDTCPCKLNSRCLSAV